MSIYEETFDLLYTLLLVVGHQLLVRRGLGRQGDENDTGSGLGLGLGLLLESDFYGRNAVIQSFLPGSPFASHTHREVKQSVAASPAAGRATSPVPKQSPISHGSPSATHSAAHSQLIEEGDILCAVDGQSTLGYVNMSVLFTVSYVRKFFCPLVIL